MIRSRLEYGIEENRAVYITLRQQFEIAKIEEAKDNLLVNMLDNAEPAVKKAKPRRTIIVTISFLIGLSLSILFVIAKETKIDS